MQEKDLYTMHLLLPIETPDKCVKITLVVGDPIIQSNFIV